MILIEKNSVIPKKFADYCSAPDATFDDLTKEAKDALRKSLLEEQGYLCAYCMSRINDSSDVKIEHFIPRNPSNELKYSNLLAVCKGNEGNPKEKLTCDSKKGDTVLRYIDPQDSLCISKIKYKKDGTVYSEDIEANEEINTVLNLNYSKGYLIKNRREAVSTLDKSLIRHDKAGAKKILEGLKKKYTQGNSVKKEPYVGILLFFIEKKLKRYEK